MIGLIIILSTVAVYLAAGSVFALFFIINGVAKVDEGAAGSGWGFRLIIIPGTILFWPLLLRKWSKVSNQEKI